MPTTLSILLGLALAITTGAIFAILWTSQSIRKMDRKFANVNAQVQKLERRTCALEEEKRESDIKYNALEGCYRALVARFDAAIEHIKALYDTIKRGGLKPPEPPEGLELDVDMKANGHDVNPVCDNTDEWRGFL